MARIAAGDLVLIRAERWRVSARTVYGPSAIVEVCGVEASNRGQSARFVQPFERIERIAVTEAPRVVRPAEWRALASAALTRATATPTMLRTAASARVDLLPFQLEPAMAVLSGFGSRVLIADAVGLGKTVQSGLIAAEILARARDGHVLIVCPAALREQWQQELERRFSLASARIDSVSLGAGAPSVGTSPWAVHRVVIASSDYVKRPEVLRGLEDMVWDLVVFDEAHTLSGRSDRAAAASALACRSRTVVMLTATPHSGADDQFATLCDLGRLPGDTPLLVFRRTRADAGLTLQRCVRWLSVVPTPAEQAMHAALLQYARDVCSASTPGARAARLAMTVLLRRASSSAYALVRSLERRITLLAAAGIDADEQLRLPFATAADEDAEPGVELAAPGLADGREECARLERILALARRAVAHQSKLRRLQRLLRRAGEPALVFTEYRDTLQHVAAALRDFTVVTLHGGLPAVERRQAERAFTTGSPRVLLATDAASEGLNLHHRCRLVINLELPWTPLRLEQRAGRVDRIGQQRAVHALHLVARGTTEEQVADRLIRRHWRAEASLDAIRRIDVETVARLVIDREEPPSLPERGRRPSGMTPDLRSVAIAEGHRLAQIRQMARRAAATPLSRVPVTLIRGRHRPEACWAWALPIVTAGDEALWEAVIGITTAVRAVPQRTPQHVRALVARHRFAIEDLARMTGRNAVAAFRDDLRQWIAVASTRERSIAAAIDAQRAALAVHLLQRDLFHHRADHRDAERSAVLDAAAGRCVARLDDLARIAAPTGAAPRLLFVALLA